MVRPAHVLLHLAQAADAGHAAGAAMRAAARAVPAAADRGRRRRGGVVAGGGGGGGGNPIQVRLPLCQGLERLDGLALRLCLQLLLRRLVLLRLLGGRAPVDATAVSPNVGEAAAA